MIEQIKYYKNIICQEEIKRTFNLPSLSGYKVPLGVMTASNVGFNTAGGLPNITGMFTLLGWGNSIGWMNGTGAFRSTAKTQTSFIGNTTGSLQAANDAMEIDASRASAIYGNLQSGARVVPGGTAMYYCIKY